VNPCSLSVAVKCVCFIQPLINGSFNRRVLTIYINSTFNVQGFLFAICAETSSPDTSELFLQGSPSQQRYNTLYNINIINNNNNNNKYKKHTVQKHTVHRVVKEYTVLSTVFKNR